MSKTAKIVAAVVVVVILVGGAGFWYLVRDDAPEAANLDAIDVPTPSGTTPGTTGSGSGSPVGGVDGTWAVLQGEDVFVGYRVDELFAGETISKTAAGRTPAVTGQVVIADGSVTEATFTADVTKLTSDKSQRDAAIGSRGLQTERFPEATFTLTEPIQLSDPVEGQEVSVEATGNLTLHGVTKPVTLDLTAKWTGSAITVAGSAPIAFADYGMDVIEIPGFVTTEDHGTLELQLVLEPA